LYASFLAAMAPFAVERIRQRMTVQNAIVVTVILFAIGFGVTRGAYLGLVAGFAVYGIVLLRRHLVGQWVLPVFVVSALATLAGVFLSAAILATPPPVVPPPGGPVSS